MKSIDKTIQIKKLEREIQKYLQYMINNGDNLTSTDFLQRDELYRQWKELTGRDYVIYLK